MAKRKKKSKQRSRGRTPGPIPRPVGEPNVRTEESCLMFEVNVLTVQDLADDLSSLVEMLMHMESMRPRPFEDMREVFAMLDEIKSALGMLYAQGNDIEGPVRRVLSWAHPTTQDYALRLLMDGLAR